MKRIALFALCTAILIALPACDAQEEHEEPVLTLVNDTEDVVVYELWAQGERRPQRLFPEETTILELVEEYGAISTLVEPEKIVPFGEGELQLRCADPELRGFRIFLHVYTFRENTATKTRDFEIVLGDAVTDVLNSINCQVVMSDTLFLERLSELSRP